MKITFLTGEYPPMQGGIADHTAYLAQHILTPEVTAYILIDRRWLETDTDAPQPLIPEARRQPIIQPLLPDWGWRCWGAIHRFLQTYRPDILHIQYQAAAFDLGGWVNWLPWYLKKRRAPTKIVTTFHDLRIPYIFPKAGPFRWRSMLALARHSDAVICTNREDLLRLEEELSVASYQLSVTSDQLSVTSDQAAGSRQQLAVSNDQSSISQSPNLPILQSPNLPTFQPSNLPTFQSPLLTLIPLGSNVESQPPANFERVAWRKRYRANENTLLLAYFGFLNESKGGGELIEAVALLRQGGIDAQLLLIGGDVGQADPTNVAYAQQVQALIERHKLTDYVHRTGYVELPQVSANFLAADAVVMPYRDGVSFRRTSLIAALRHSCPIISALPVDLNLIPEIRPGQNMLLASPGDAAALAQAIAPLAEDVALRQRLSAGAKQLGALFEWEKIAEETSALYRRVAQ